MPGDRIAVGGDGRVILRRAPEPVLGREQRASAARRARRVAARWRAPAARRPTPGGQRRPKRRPRRSFSWPWRRTSRPLETVGTPECSAGGATMPPCHGPATSVWPPSAPTRAQRAPRSAEPRAIARLMNREDRRAVRRRRPRWRRPSPRPSNGSSPRCRAAAGSSSSGAGTSGRLGVIEAAECPPTFGTRPGLVQAIMAGGRQSVFRSREGAEDDARAAARVVRARVRAATSWSASRPAASRRSCTAR